MQSAQCCEIFDIFIFLLLYKAKSPGEFLTWTFSPIHRVFGGISLHSMLHSENTARAIVMCIWCAQNATARDATTWKRGNDRKNLEKVQQQPRQLDSFNTF